MGEMKKMKVMIMMMMNRKKRDGERREQNKEEMKWMKRKREDYDDDDDDGRDDTVFLSSFPSYFPFSFRPSFRLSFSSFTLTRFKSAQNQCQIGFKSAQFSRYSMLCILYVHLHSIPSSLPFTFINLAYPLFFLCLLFLHLPSHRPTFMTRAPAAVPVSKNAGNQTEGISLSFAFRCPLLFLLLTPHYIYPYVMLFLYPFICPSSTPYCPPFYLLASSHWASPCLVLPCSCSCSGIEPVM